MGNHFETDVLIVGGGPAGASTALGLLSYSDLRVTIVEHSAFDKIRVGEQVNPSLFEFLDYLKINKGNLEENGVIHGYGSLAAWGSHRVSSRDSIFSTQGENYQIDREQFDLHLIKEASMKGADVLPRTRCTNFRQIKNKEWKIELKHRSRGNYSAKAKFLIDATGRQSNLCRKLGIRSVKYDELIAVGAFFHFEKPCVLRQETLIETIPEGWWYYATLPNQRVTVTLFTDADIVKHNQFQKIENWKKLVSNTLHIKHKMKNASSFEDLWVKNAFSQVTRPDLKKHLIAVGDAAASFDPVSSMGIGFAVSSGCHAANAIINYENGDHSAITNYQQNIERIFGDYLKNRSQFYYKERRWRDSVFWQRRINVN